jgi:hypothetical protein
MSFSADVALGEQEQGWTETEPSIAEAPLAALAGDSV